MKRYNALIGDLPAKSDRASVLTELEELLRANYVGEVSAPSVTASGLKGYIEGLGDANARFLTDAEYDAYLQTESGVYTGSGLTLRFDASGPALAVTKSERGSSAYRQGVRQGDRITAVDTQGVTEANVETLTAKITEALPKTVQLRVTPADGGEPRTVTVEKTYRTDDIESDTDNGVGYLRIRGFYESTPSLFKARVDEFTSAGVTSLIIDLRGCESWQYESCLETADLFAPASGDISKPLASFLDKNGETKRTFSATPGGYSLKVTVLVDRDTAGAAELFACVLRDFGLAKLVGEKTAGVGVVREVFRLEGAGWVLIPVQRVKPYLSPVFDGAGLTPDENMPLPENVRTRVDTLSHTLDAQYLGALELLEVPAPVSPPEETTSPDEPASEPGEDETDENETGEEPSVPETDESSDE